MIIFQNNATDEIKKFERRKDAKEYAEAALKAKCCCMLVKTKKEIFNVDSERSREYFGIKRRK